MANESIIKDLFKTALATIITTALGVFVTYYATNAINKEQHKKDESEKAKQQKEATSKVDDRIIEYEKKISELEGRIATMGGAVEKNYGVSPTSADINGMWRTSDGTVKWNFDNGNLTIGGAGLYDGILNANGSYTLDGNTIKGSVTTSVVYYMPNSQILAFSLHPSGNGTLTGYITEGNGTNSSAVLYRY